MNEFDRLVGLLKSNVYGDWEVLSNGDLTNQSASYFIPANRLCEDWIKHLHAKQWVNMGDFLKAYFAALKMAGHSEIVIKL